MRINSLKAKIKAGQQTTLGWLSIPSTYSAEIAGHAGFDAVLIDLQHGMIFFETALPMLQAISATPAIPLVRIHANDGPMMMKLLDAGAYGVVCPMISTAAQAAAFVSACRYPPVGDRSYGPGRGFLYGGADYFKHADAEVMTWAMIETTEGLDNLEAIAATAGLDGLFIGPNDLAIALGCLPSTDTTEPTVIAAIARVLETCKRHKIAAGIFCNNADVAKLRMRQGFDMIVPGNDAGILTAASKAAVAKAKEGLGNAAPPLTSNTVGGY